jgi:hypothetical protein
VQPIRRLGPWHEREVVIPAGARNHFTLDLGLDRRAGWQSMRRVPASRRPDTAAIRHPAPSADCPAAAHCVEAFAHHPYVRLIARPTVVASRTSSILGDFPNPPNFEDVGVWAICVAEVFDAGTTVACFDGRFGGWQFGNISTDLCVNFLRARNDDLRDQRFLPE